MKTKLEKLALIGLNIFTSLKISQLPEEIRNLISAQGFKFDLEDSLCLVGAGGKTLWNNLEGKSFDQFSVDAIRALNLGPRFLYPVENFHFPLQRLSRLMNLSSPSPLGLDIHPEFGLWWAFRAAFITSMPIDHQSIKSFESPCETCIDMPCISACPVNAVAKNSAFKISACANQRLAEQSSCLEICHSRASCPIKKEHQYSSEQISYHMLNSLNNINLA